MGFWGFGHLNGYPDHLQAFSGPELQRPPPPPFFLSSPLLCRSGGNDSVSSVTVQFQPNENFRQISIQIFGKMFLIKIQIFGNGVFIKYS